MGTINSSVFPMQQIEDTLLPEVSQITVEDTALFLVAISCQAGKTVF